MPARYTIIPGEDGWTVWGTWRGEPAEVGGVAQVGLPLEDADDLADLLSLVVHANENTPTAAL